MTHSNKTGKKQSSSGRSLEDLPQLDQPEIREALDDLYDFFNHRRWVHPDPLEFLYEWDNTADREIVGMIAANLAYGNVKQILTSVSRVLERLPEPAHILKESSIKNLRKEFRSFRHRFTSGEDLVWMLECMSKTIRRHGSLENCFLEGMQPEEETVLPALSRFIEALAGGRKAVQSHWILASPWKSSACKRLHLYLRWMVRSDEVDPGGWSRVPAAKLIVPLDTHMFRIARETGWTDRRQAGAATALEVTEALRKINPEDPVRYDFALTRLGILRYDRMALVLDTLRQAGNS